MAVNENELYRFILDNIDTVPHLEGLLLLWNGRPRALSEHTMAARLFVTGSGIAEITRDLARHGLIAVQEGDPAQCSYLSSPQNDRLVEALAEAYKTDLIRISTAIHRKASAGVREFARAFEFKRKERKP